jgi:hypothetical protein
MWGKSMYANGLRDLLVFLGWFFSCNTAMVKYKSSVLGEKMGEVCLTTTTTTTTSGCCFFESKLFSMLFLWAVLDFLLLWFERNWSQVCLAMYSFQKFGLHPLLLGSAFSTNLQQSKLLPIWFWVHSSVFFMTNLCFHSVELSKWNRVGEDTT